MKKLIYLCMALFVIACASKKIETAPSVSKASSGSTFAPPAASKNKVITAENFKTSVPNFTYVEFEKGKMLYQTKCNKCHELKSIDSESAEGWNKEVTEMVVKHNRKFDDKIDLAGESLIKGYVLSALELGL